MVGGVPESDGSAGIPMTEDGHRVHWARSKFLPRQRLT